MRQAVVQCLERLRHVSDNAVIEDQGPILWRGAGSLLSKQLLRELKAAGGIDGSAPDKRLLALLAKEVQWPILSLHCKR